MDSAAPILIFGIRSNIKICTLRMTFRIASKWQDKELNHLIKHSSSQTNDIIFLDVFFLEEIINSSFDFSFEN